jgi:hypothetical protein
MGHRASRYHIEINILHSKQILHGTSLDDYYKKIRLGLDAISMCYKNKIAIFKNSIPIKYGYTVEKTLQRLAQKCGIQESLILSADTELSTYKVIEFREDILTKNNKNGLYDLYRDNPIILQKEVTQSSLSDSLYLTFSLLKKFVENATHPAYQYDMNTCEWHASDKPEAILRLLASIYVLATLANHFQDKHALESSKSVIQNLIDKYYVSNHQMGYLNVHGIIDIGIGGCLFLAINEINSDAFQHYKHALSNFIQSAFDQTNKKFIPILNNTSHTALHESEYYFPGIALTSLLSNQPNNKIIEIAEAAFPYYYDLFKNNNDGIKMLTWMTPAYTKLFHLTQNKKYKNFVYDMTDRVLQKQISFNNADEIDLIGSFTKTGNTRTTAAILESIIDSYILADISHDYSRAEQYESAILMGLRFLLQAQFRQDNTFDHNALGGYKNNFFNNVIRIDNIQHTAFAIFKFLNTNFFK